MRPNLIKVNLTMIEKSYEIKQHWVHYFFGWMRFLLLVVPFFLGLTYGGCGIAALIKGGEVKDYLPLGLEICIGYLVFLRLIAFLRWKTHKWLVFEDRFELHTGAVFPWNRGVTPIKWEHASVKIHSIGFLNWLFKIGTLTINIGYDIPMTKNVHAIYQDIASRIEKHNFRYGAAEKIKAKDA